MKLISSHPAPPIPLTDGIGWPSITARIEFDFVVAGLPNEIIPCRHATARRAMRASLELWQIPKALVAYRSASIIVSVVCLDCALAAKAEPME